MPNLPDRSAELKVLGISQAFTKLGKCRIDADVVGKRMRYARQDRDPLVDHTRNEGLAVECRKIIDIYGKPIKGGSQTAFQ